ncbi:MAG: histidine triad nucleotide-binding protein [Gimesia sp.]|nr:histidine triad nucleotide-binding protein [Gimesia sp.]
MSGEKTIFKKIIDREIPAEIIYEDEFCMAFNDVNPQAPIHVLVIPKQEIASMAQLNHSDQELAGHLMLTVAKLAKTLGLENGYRTIVNTGTEGGQTVDHLHLHLLGGRSLQWPPG